MSKVSSLYTVRVICGFVVVSFNLSTNGEYLFDMEWIETMILYDFIIY